MVVVGGASRMPGLRAHLEKLFPTHNQTQLHMTDATLNAVRQCWIFLLVRYDVDEQGG